MKTQKVKPEKKSESRKKKVEEPLNEGITESLEETTKKQKKQQTEESNVDQESKKSKKSKKEPKEPKESKPRKSKKDQDTPKDQTEQTSTKKPRGKKQKNTESNGTSDETQHANNGNGVSENGVNGDEHPPHTNGDAAQSSEPAQETSDKKESKRSKKEPKKKRTLNEKQTTMDKSGISIGPARVKDVLMNIALNHDEFKLRELLLQSKSKIRSLSDETTKTSKKEQTEPEKEVTPPSLDDLSEEYKTIIREAEESYEYSLLESFEKEYYNSLSHDETSDFSEQQKKYRDAKKAFKKQSEDNETEFSLYDFLNSHLTDFENKFEEFKYFKDNYAVRSKDDPKFDRVREKYEVKHVENILKDKNKNNKLIKEKYTNYHERRSAAEAEAKKNNTPFNLKQFNLEFDPDFYKNFEKYDAVKRCIVLVSKTGIRISSNGRNIIACFLDRIVQQYATNAITNCISKQKHIVRLRHALIKGENFKNLVPLYPFVNTLENYDLAIQHVVNANQPQETKDDESSDSSQDKKQRKKMKKQNRFEGRAYGRVFYGYISEICRYVKLQFVSTCSEEDKKLYLETSISKEFKHFCSFIVNETIFRIGNALKKYVKQQGVKTISDNMVSFILEQIHIICGINYEQTEQQMNKQLEKFDEWKQEKKKLKSKKSETPETTE